MSIGTTIKKLRREHKITQEQLAEYLGITSRAVSQWECDRTAPDISQLPLLANIFNVSADVLLGIDNSKKNEVIRDFLNKYDELSNKGDLMSRFSLTKEMYRQNPNDFRICEKYILELFYDPNYLQNPLGETIHKDELYKLCNNILDNCITQKIKYTAMNILLSLYVNDGLIEKAKEICEQFPESIYDIVSEQYEQLYSRCDNAKYIEYVKRNIRYTTEHLINKIINFGTFAVQNAEEKICIYKKCLAFIDLIYDEQDYGFSYYHVGHINCLIAQLYLEMNDSENTMVFLERGLCFCKKYDELPKEIRHTSLLLQNDCEDMTKIYNGTSMNRVSYEINEFQKLLTEKPPVKSYEDIIRKFKAYAKNR